MSTQHIDSLIIGAGRAGLASGYQLQRRGRECLIVDGVEQVGDSWRRLWDSLRLFTPGRYNSLPGLPFPGEARRFPGEDEISAYLETYSLVHDLPVRLRTRVERLEGRPGGGFVAQHITDHTSACAAIAA